MGRLHCLNIVERRLERGEGFDMNWYVQLVCGIVLHAIAFRTINI